MSSKRKINVIEIKNGFAGSSLPRERDELQVIFVDEDKNEQWVFCVPKDWRMDFGMNLITADGCKADVQLTWPKPPKAPKAPKTPTPKPVKKVAKKKVAKKR